MKIRISRRQLLKACLALGGAGTLAVQYAGIWSKRRNDAQLLSHVEVLHVESYEENLSQILMEGLLRFPFDVRGKTVLLKPNLVDCHQGRAIHTHAKLVGATIDCCMNLGARKILVGEGSGHVRDSEFLLEESGLGKELQQRRIPFIDLNRDALVKTKLKQNVSGLDHLWLPKIVLESDFLVSMPKVKTHHWAGVTLSRKNLFGIVPGMKYSWPKNLLHWHGIHRCIADLCATVPIHFVIADAIEVMIGNGPLHGESRKKNSIILSDDSIAADLACTRLLGMAC